MHAVGGSRRIISLRMIVVPCCSVILLALWGCGASTASLNPNDSPDLLPATVIDANPDDYEVTASQSARPGAWDFSVRARRTRATTDGLVWFWDFGDGATHTGVTQAYSFEEPGRYVIIVTAKTESGTVAFLLTLEIDVPAFNRTPKAVVGPDQPVDENESVFLDGSQSSDADGDELTFFWRQVSGPAVFLTGGDAAIASFVAPTIDTDAQLVFVLEVSDGENSAEATTTINVADVFDPAGTGPGSSPTCQFTVLIDNADSPDVLDGQRPLTVTATASIIGSILPSTGTLTWTFDGVAETGLITIRQNMHTFSTAGVHRIALALTLGGVTVGCHSVQSGTDEAQVIVWPAISGKVVNDTGTPVNGVTVSASAGGTTAVTDSKGDYHVYVPYRWSGLVTVQHTDYDFDTSQVSFSGVQDDVANQSFVARPRGGTGTPPGGTANLAPFADAGPDRTVLDTDDNGFQTVMLNGSLSTDSDGTIVSYVWTEDGAGLGSGVVVPKSLPVGPHAITLTVTDNEGATGTDSVLFLITSPATPQNILPVANAGPDQTVNDADRTGAERVTLTASGSSDADGSIVSYEWFDGGVPVATGVSPSVEFTVGTHTVTLVVTDDAGAPAQDSVVITVTAPPPLNQNPIANAGADQTVTDADGSGSEAVTLDGRASRDNDGTIVSYRWLEGSTTLYTGSNATTSVTFAVGTHDLTLRVTDDDGATADDSVRVIVTAPAGNQPPMANAGPDRTVEDVNLNGSELVTLDASASSDPNGTIVSYRWTEGTTTLYTGSSATTAVTFTVGTHNLTLRVTDNDGATADDALRVVVSTPTPPGFWYVDRNSATASDTGPGTEATPFRTIQKAANVVNPGDTVYVKAGTYPEAVTCSRSGTATSRITFKNFGNDLVTIDGGGLRGHCFDITGNYITVDGFTMKNAARTGHAMMVRVYNCLRPIVRNCHIFKDDYAGYPGPIPPEYGLAGIFVLGPAQDALIELNHVHHTSGAIRFGFSNPAGAPIRPTARWNHVHHVNMQDYEGQNNGMGIWYGNQTTQGLAEYNLAHHCDDQGIGADRSQGHIFRYNICYLMDPFNTPGGGGGGLKTRTVPDTITAQDLIHHNVAFLNQIGYIFTFYDGQYGPQVFNNIAFANYDRGLTVNWFASGIAVARVKNNIAAANGGVDLDYATPALGASDYNFVADGRFNLSVSPHTRSGNPMFANIQLLYTDANGDGTPDVFDALNDPSAFPDAQSAIQYAREMASLVFSLQPASPARDTGLDLGLGLLDINGLAPSGGPDMGAYEFHPN